MGLQLVTPPAVEPVTLAEARSWCRIDFSNMEPAPTAVTVALAGAGAGNVDNGAHRYLATFVTADGQTQAGTVSSAVTVADKAVNGQVSVTAIPTGGAAVTSRKLYRTAAGGSTYMLLATIADNTTTTYTDNTADASLGAGAPSTNTTGDPVLVRLIKSAREYAEHYCQRAFITQTWRLTLDAFPCYDPRLPAERQYEIRIPRPKLIGVVDDEIDYINAAGDAATLDLTDDFVLDTQSEPGRILPAYGTSWPSTRRQANAVTIDYTCGYGSAGSVPEALKQWMQARIKTLFDNRTSVEVGHIVQEWPASYVDGLLDPLRVYSL